MTIDHLGIVVPSLDKAIQHWHELFAYVKNSEIVINTRQKVRVVFLAKRDSITIKLIEPLEPSSPAFAFAQKGGGLHHICFRCEDLQSELQNLKQKGARLVVPPQPGEAFKNREIAFLFANNINFEVIDTSEKEGWLGEP